MLPTIARKSDPVCATLCFAHSLSSDSNCSLCCTCNGQPQNQSSLFCYACLTAFQKTWRAPFYEKNGDTLPLAGDPSDIFNPSGGTAMRSALQVARNGPAPCARMRPLFI